MLKLFSRSCRSLSRIPLRRRTPNYSVISHHHHRTIFDVFSKKSDTGTLNDSHLHVFLLKDGNKHLKEENALMSINDYDQAIEIQKTSESYSKRAFAYFHIKDYVQANNDVQEAIKLNPRSIEALCCASSIQIALGEHQKALQYLTDAYDLTSPMDFRRNSIQQVINGCKMQFKVNSQSQSQPPIQPEVESTPKVETKENVFVGETESQIASGVGVGVGVGSTATANAMTDAQMENAAEKLTDMPFDNNDFMDLQKDITQQMVDIGGEDFQSKLLKLNEIPSVQVFQRKAMSGEKPSYDDYMQLMKDPKFQKYNAIMTEIAQNPKFSSITQKFAQMDWMGAYEELQKDPEALQLYMKAFEGLDD